ncbi:MAG: zinc ABC transporter substrate-binding protein [Pseudomonadota bacterium]
MRVLRFLLSGWLFACFASATFAQDQTRVIAVNYPLQYFAQRLLGDTAEVVFPVPEGVDPSFWRPSIADISMIQSSDLILLNGAGFATWVDRVSLPRSKVINTSASIEDQFIITESITHSHGDGGEHSHEGLASYTWLDPSLASAQAQAIANAVIARGLAPEDAVNQRLEALRRDLDALDLRASQAVGVLAGQHIIATHPRYEYFARRHDLSLSSLAWEAGAVPNEAEISDLRALVAKTKATLLIWEATPPSGAFEFAEELGLQNIIFDPLAHGIDGQSFFEAYDTSLSAIAALEDQ